MTAPSGGEPQASGDEHDAEAYCSTCSRSYPPDVERCPDDGTRLVRFAAHRDPMLGRTLDGRFEVRERLGKGGMGTVYRALQLSVDREVAVKVIHPRLASDRPAAKRFLREARLASRLSQPSVVQVIDFGQTEDGVLYLVMELLRGRTLSSELSGERRFSVRRAATIGMQLCDALEAAHAQGIVHRDLKPGNIVVLDDPPGRDLIKVLDFGLAKSLVADTSQVTNTDAILGTPLYMCPEQVQGRPSDQRGDLYSLGCILHELVSGLPPFVDESVNLIMARHLTDAPPPLPPHAPARLRTLVERLLAKEPEQRVQTAAEVREVLQELVIGSAAVLDVTVAADDTVPDVGVEFAATADLEQAATRVTPPTPVTAATPSTSLDHRASVARRAGTRRALVVLALALAAALAVVLVARGRGRSRGQAGGAAPAVDAGSAVDAGAVVDVAPAVDAGAAVDVAPTLDAGPALDGAAAMGAPYLTVDAGAAATRPRPRRDVDAGTSPPPRPLDAGVAPPRPIDAAPPRPPIDADIDFYPSR